MDLKIGMRLFAQNSSCEVIVIKISGTVGAISCAGLEMLPDAPGETVPKTSDGPLVELGKRYSEEDELIELLCSKGGVGPLAADGRVLRLKAAKPLPASD